MRDIFCIVQIEAFKTFDKWQNAKKKKQICRRRRRRRRCSTNERPVKKKM